MIELKNDSLVFSFPEIHPKASISINFQRTLRIPDDDNTYPLPPGLGSFQLKHVDDYAVPKNWVKRGGIMLPMFQSEAMWLNFDTDYMYDRSTGYPFAIKVATGKINALTGKPWDNSLNRSPQNYMISTEQPWLDGYCVEKNIIRQFVAMPLGSGYSTEEQVTGDAEFGGLQIMVFPMKREVFEQRFPEQESDLMHMCLCQPQMQYSSCDMGLSPGGKMHQEIYKDPFDFSDWDQTTKERCFVNIANSLVWRAVTGEYPQTLPLTAKEYADNNFPWFEYYDDNSERIDGSAILNNLKSVIQKEKETGEITLPENTSVKPENIKTLSSANLPQSQENKNVFPG